jgi:hypothetical protein
LLADPCLAALLITGHHPFPLCILIFHDPSSSHSGAYRIMPGHSGSCLLLFSFAMDASVDIFMGQTSMQDSDLEQVFPKCSA